MRPASRKEPGDQPVKAIRHRRHGPGPIASAGAPRWRELLEARWRARLQRVIELSITYHSTAVASSADSLASARPLLRKAVAARRALADTDDALARLASGRYGRCEQCADDIPPRLLAAAPETRYCPGCIRGLRPGPPPERRVAL